MEPLNVVHGELDLSGNTGRGQNIHPPLPSHLPRAYVALLDQVAHQKVGHAKSYAQLVRQVALAQLRSRLHLLQKPQLPVGLSLQISRRLVVTVTHESKP